jgi:hypothetical protein
MAERRRRKPSPRPGAADAGTPAPAPPEPPPAADALIELIAKTYRPLSAEEEEAVRTTLGIMHQAAKALHEFPLTNADEPDFTFATYRLD